MENQVKQGDTVRKNGTDIQGVVSSVNDFGDVIVRVEYPYNSKGYVEHRFFAGSYTVVR